MPCHLSSSSELELYKNHNYIALRAALFDDKFFSVIDLIDSNLFWEKNLAVFCNKSRTWTSRMFHFYQSFDESQSVLLVKVISLNSMKKKLRREYISSREHWNSNRKAMTPPPPSPQPSQDQIKRGDKARWQKSCIYAVFHTFFRMEDKPK